MGAGIGTRHGGPGGARGKIHALDRSRRRTEGGAAGSQADRARNSSPSGICAEGGGKAALVVGSDEAHQAALWCIGCVCQACGGAVGAPASEIVARLCELPMSEAMLVCLHAIARHVPPLEKQVRAHPKQLFPPLKTALLVCLHAIARHVPPLEKQVRIGFHGSLSPRLYHHHSSFPPTPVQARSHTRPTGA